MQRNHDGGRQNQSRYGDGTGVINPRAKQRAVCIGVFKSANQGQLSELKELLRTARVAVAGEMVQIRPKPDPDHYFGKGKLEELKTEIKRNNANLVATDDELSPRQERNLESAVGVPVVDRTATILDIFADHAGSAEGKLQVELAQLEYNMARMRGLWSHLERLGGGIGTRGPGETQIETDRRLARNRIKALKNRIQRERGHRQLMRQEREETALPTVALAGYTNAGKSTLLNALTSADVSTAERLFETLDPTTRKLTYRSRVFLLTDTVGFIRKLPHQLIDAFSATLEETQLADIILHVVDASVELGSIATNIEVVDAVLDEIGANRHSRLVVFNKIDLAEDSRRRYLQTHYRGAVQVSAQDKIGLDRLKDTISDACDRQLQQVQLLVPYSEGAQLSRIYSLAADLQRTDTKEGVLIDARLPSSAAKRFLRFQANEDRIA